MSRKIFSVDVETEKLYGKQAFAIGAVVLVDGVVYAEFEGRAPTPRHASQWVRENVLLAIKEMPVTHKSVLELEEDFWRFWIAHRVRATTVAYFGNQGGEHALFCRMIERDYRNRLPFAPSPVHELCTLMIARGFPNIHSYDQYMLEHKLKPACNPQHLHHPLYDAHAAALVWEHLMQIENKNA